MELIRLGIVLHAAPYESQGVHSALRLLRTAVASDHHQVLAVVLLGAASVLAVADAAAGSQANLRSQWLSLAESGGFELLVCPSALARRGFQRHSLAAPWRLQGMVESLAQLAQADRLVEFR